MAHNQEYSPRMGALKIILKHLVYKLMRPALYPYAQQTFRGNTAARNGRALWSLRHIRPEFPADRPADRLDLLQQLLRRL